MLKSVNVISLQSQISATSRLACNWPERCAEAPIFRPINFESLPIGWLQSPESGPDLSLSLCPSDSTPKIQGGGIGASVGSRPRGGYWGLGRLRTAGGLGGRRSPRGRQGGRGEEI